MNNINGADARQQYILEYINKNEFVDVTRLSEELGVSEMTVRRDFMKMEVDKLLLRVHGGAVPIPKSSSELPLNRRISVNSQEKNVIGKYAASLVEPGEAIALDASTTVLMMAKYLTVEATVVTNNIEAVLHLISNPLIELILLGGSVRKPSASTVGFEMIQMMEHYTVDKVFLSSKAVDIVHGITDATPNEGEAKKAMLATGNKIYLLMDHTKLNMSAFYKVCNLNNSFHIITDAYDGYSDAQKQFIQYCKEADIPIHFAK